MTGLFWSRSHKGDYGQCNINFFILLLESGSNTTEPNSHFHKKTVKSDLILLSASGDQREVNIILWRICKWILSQTINLFINSLWHKKLKTVLQGDHTNFSVCEFSGHNNLLKCRTYLYPRQIHFLGYKYVK